MQTDSLGLKGDQRLLIYIKLPNENADYLLAHFEYLDKTVCFCFFLSFILKVILKP